VVVENRGGAGGSVGATIVAQSPHDGYTLLLGTGSTHGTNPNVYTKLGYDPVRDFVPVALITSAPLVLVANNEVPVKTAADLAGKKLGVSNMASSTIVITKSTLRPAGVAITDEAFLPVGVGDSALAALRSGQVQALSLWDSAYASMLRTGISFRYIYHPTMADFGSGMFFASDSTISTKSAALARFTRAVAKATVLYEENPAAALQIYWKANPAAKVGATDEQARAAGLAEITYMVDTFTLAKKSDKRYGVQEMEKLQQYIDMYRDEGVISARVNAGDLAMDAFVV